MPWRFLDAGWLSVRSVVFAGVQNLQKRSFGVGDVGSMSSFGRKRTWLIDSQIRTLEQDELMWNRSISYVIARASGQQTPTFAVVTGCSAFAEHDHWVRDGQAKIILL
ncbi:MAG: hypothetical protein R3D52_10560 [Xanthobacteraceae bacterium]